MPRYGILPALWMLAAAAGLLSAAEPVEPDSLRRALDQVTRLQPQRPEDCTAERTSELRAAAQQTEQAASELLDASRAASLEQLLSNLQRLLVAHRVAEDVLDRTLDLRRGFSPHAGDEAGRELVRQFLRETSHLIDLSGRLRYLLFDALSVGWDRAHSDGPASQSFLALLAEHRSGIGAIVVSSALLPARPPAATSPPPETLLQVLRLIGDTGQNELVPEIAEFLRAGKPSPALAIEAAEIIRRVGLPQDPRPGQEADVALPPITAKGLHAILAALPESQLTSDLAARRAALLDWLSLRMKVGLDERSYPLGRFDVQPGDFLLMRNPSPYNLFTDLSPGLFTHVGVVTLEEGSDGIRRMVLVDLPEAGRRMLATNVDAFMPRTLHYVFLRHPVPAAARRMGQIAAGIIGNETEFDLNFRTDRVLALRGQPLAGRKIHTYCAGLLLLCAQETGLPRSEFFPISETTAGGHTAANLKLLGLSFGQDFVSPTGALFSPRLEIVGRREPMYDPGRQIEETVFDYFATSMADGVLLPTPDSFQSLRLKVAEASKLNPLLAGALAKAAGLNAEVDLVAAARAAAVIETLDEVAYAASGNFVDARDAIRAGPLAQLKNRGYEAEEIARFGELRQRHADLHQRWEQRQISPRELRQELVEHYIRKGRTGIDQRFFGISPK
ncbi:MAG: hypothetical protein HY000_12325 [Planctomycetes bacterium]|nr:hypothetical protein [Planctomycetota bacterium]